MHLIPIYDNYEENDFARWAYAHSLDGMMNKEIKGITYKNVKGDCSPSKEKRLKELREILFAFFVSSTGWALLISMYLKFCIF